MVWPSAVKCNIHKRFFVWRCWCLDIVTFSFNVKMLITSALLLVDPREKEPISAVISCVDTTAAIGSNARSPFIMYENTYRTLNTRNHHSYSRSFHRFFESFLRQRLIWETRSQSLIPWAFETSTETMQYPNEKQLCFIWYPLKFRLFFTWLKFWSYCKFTTLFANVQQKHWLKFFSIIQSTIVKIRNQTLIKRELWNSTWNFLQSNSRSV